MTPPPPHPRSTLLLVPPLHGPYFPSPMGPLSSRRPPSPTPLSTTSPTPCPCPPAHSRGRGEDTAGRSTSKTTSSTTPPRPDVVAGGPDHPCPRSPETCDIGDWVSGGVASVPILSYPVTPTPFGCSGLGGLQGLTRGGGRAVAAQESSGYLSWPRHPVPWRWQATLESYSLAGSWVLRLTSRQAISHSDPPSPSCALASAQSSSSRTRGGQGVQEG